MTSPPFARYGRHLLLISFLDLSWTFPGPFPEPSCRYGRDLLLINFQCPAKGGGSVSVVLWWVMTERAAEDARFTGLWRRFMDSGDDKRR